MNETPASTVAELNRLWLDLMRTVRAGYTGQIILHCNGGQVQKVEERRFRRVHDEMSAPRRATQ